MPTNDPMFHITLDGFLKLWQLVAVPVLAWGATILKGILKEFRILNSRVTTLEVRVTAEERRTSDRFEAIRRELDQQEGHRPGGP